MRYEPMGYIIEYEAGALVIFLIIMLRYFAARRFPNQRSKLFTLIFWAAVMYMVLDILSSIIIDNVFLLPISVTYVVNSAFYCSSILLLMLMTVYVMALSDYVSGERMKKMAPIFLPGVAVILLLIINPLTSWFFYVDPVRGYVHGEIFMYTYITCFFYLVATFILTFCGRKKLRREEATTLYKCLAVILGLTLVQFFVPALLTIGVSIAISVILMYFTLQNPETMLDTATGAFTYDAMLTFLRDRMQERDRVQLVAVKIYNMNRVNELLGVENGSLLLGRVSAFLRESGSDCWVFRMRGSCFVVITRESEDYHNLCARLDQRIGQSWKVGGTDIMLQATICCIATEEFLESPITPEEAVNYLETAFLQNERSGSRIKNINAGAELLSKIKRSQAVAAALAEAIETGEGLELYYQPLWSVRRQRFVNAEVLLRFNHPVMGFISPEEFVPIAENNGLVTAMDELVVRKACRFISDGAICRELGLDTLEINLSALEFMHSSLPQLLKAIMTQYRVDPEYLCFEITETAATESFELLKECMEEIQKIGCGFALDDFGTGYANISQVIQLPFSIVKLDKSLLYGPGVVLEDMARMFGRINRQTVVEGVETEAQAEMVKSFGVDLIQGYFYARPMNQDDFIRFMKSR